MLIANGICSLHTKLIDIFHSGLKSITKFILINSAKEGRELWQCTSIKLSRKYGQTYGANTLKTTQKTAYELLNRNVLNKWLSSFERVCFRVLHTKRTLIFRESWDCHVWLVLRWTNSNGFLVSNPVNPEVIKCCFCVAPKSR